MGATANLILSPVELSPLSTPLCALGSIPKVGGWLVEQLVNFQNITISESEIAPRILQLLLLLLLLSYSNNKVK